MVSKRRKISKFAVCRSTQLWELDRTKLLSEKTASIFPLKSCNFQTEQHIGNLKQAGGVPLMDLRTPQTWCSSIHPTLRTRHWSQGYVVTTTSPRFLQHSTGFQCAVREWCSRLWCWCGIVLTALLPATSPNSAFMLPQLQVVSISGQPRQAYKFPEPEPWSAGGASLSRDRLCGTVFRLLYGD